MRRPHFPYSALRRVHEEPVLEALATQQKSSYTARSHSSVCHPVYRKDSFPTQKKREHRQMHIFFKIKCPYLRYALYKINQDVNEVALQLLLIVLTKHEGTS